MIALQNLRAVTSGVQPTALEPGQLCFNMPDKLMFVGDGSDTKTPFGGSPVPGVIGQGWFSVPLSFDGLSDTYVVSPRYYGDIPIDGQVLSWNTSLNRVVWSTNSSSGSTSYLTTNAEVAAAPGADISSKISNALGVTPLSGDSAIVTGSSEDTYQAFYQFISGNWVFASSYAPPLAQEVPIAPVVGLTALNVQDALEEILSIAEAAQTTASNALSVANNALPESGGTMSGDIQFTDGQPVDAGSF